jgi:tetratricopeptide (TPR) repeat protein
MYLKGSKWNMKRKRRRPSSPWRILLLLVLIGAALYINQVVVPATPPLFIPTPTPTRNPESYINEADALYADGKLVQAIEAYKQAILANPDNPSLYITLAQIQVFTGRYEDALESAERALILNNNNPLAHAVKGWALDFLGDYTQAEGSIKRALELDANNPVAHAYYAEILIDKNLAGQGDIGAIEKAAEESKIALSLAPNTLETLRARGYVLWNTGNYEEAIQQYKAAVAINDKIADLHMALGYNYDFLGEYDLAVQEFLQAVALNPTDPIAPLEISRTYSTVGDFSQAVQYADQAVKADPTNPKWHGNLGVMYYKNNQMDQAIEQLGLAIRGGSMADGSVVEGLPLDYGSVAEYYAIYGLALAKSDQCGQAVPIFQAIRSGVPDDEINVYNAEQGLIICQENLEATTTEEVTGASEEGTTPTP